MKAKLLINLPIASSLVLLGLSGIVLAQESGRLELDSTPPIREGSLGGFADIVEKVSPSVVSVYSSQRAAPNQGGYYLYDPRSGQTRRWNQAPRQQLSPTPQGLGSGVILTSDGYIVTNRHVVEGADEVKVTVGERSEPYHAMVVGMDEATDVAVLKINATGLKAIRLADSNNLKVGDVALAIGSPFGLRHTVTSGIISALDRSELGLIGRQGYENFIQTDASINPGNSGGALVDNRGRMIGINTAIFSKTGANVGIGFAIPMDIAAGVANQLIEQGEVHRGFLGVALGDMTPELAAAMKSGRDGAIVHDVVADSPAEKSDLRPGDVVTKFDGRAIADSAKLRLLVGSTRPGSEVELEIVRDGETQKLLCTIGGGGEVRVAAAEIPRAKPVPRPRAEVEFLAGVETVELSRSLRAQLGVQSDIQGIVIRSVAPGSAAAKAGLQVGEIITEVARQPVSNYDEAIKAKAQGKSDVMLLRVVGANGSRFVAIDHGTA